MRAFLENLDRRWIFLLVLIAVSTPILLKLTFPEAPSKQVRTVFSAIDDLDDGSRVLIALDYDPSSKGELEPMASAFTRQCALKKHKLYFMTLWPQGTPMVNQAIDILKNEFPDYEYGTDYVNLGYQTGGEAVIKKLASDLHGTFNVDANNEILKNIPMTQNLKNVRDMDLIVNVSAGDPGTKQWVLFISTPHNIKTVAGVTGVTAPTLYAYIPRQLSGILGAIKAAAEYEYLLIQNYPELKENPKAKEGLRRMGPQLVAHVLIIVLIIIGNIIFFTGRRQGTSV